MSSASRYGYASRISSGVCPAARSPRRRDTGNRKPRTHGFPPKISESIVIRSNFISCHLTRVSSMIPYRFQITFIRRVSNGRYNTSSENSAFLRTTSRMVLPLLWASRSPFIRFSSSTAFYVSVHLRFSGRRSRYVVPVLSGSYSTNRPTTLPERRRRKKAAPASEHRISPAPQPFADPHHRGSGACSPIKLGGLVHP